MRAQISRQDRLAVPFVVSLNMKRRHLNESQRAMVAAKIANLPQGYGDHVDVRPIGLTSQGEAAALMSVGERMVRRARVVQERAVLSGRPDWPVRIVPSPLPVLAPRRSRRGRR